MLALDLHGISKSFYDNRGKEKKVLDDINIRVESGQIFGLLGLNGIGKTTTIKIMLDLLDPDIGDVRFFDLKSTDCFSRKNICYLPEKFQPSSYLTGYEFLEISQMFFDKKLDKDKAKEMAEKVDLDPDALGKVIKAYSKGMCQKIGLLSCFLSNARLLILDEPMSGLDPKSRIKVKEQILAYKQNDNSVFFSSHILTDVDEICTDIAVLNDSHILFYGKCEDLKKKSAESSLEKAFLKLIS